MDDDHLGFVISAIVLDDLGDRHVAGIAVAGILTDSNAEFGDSLVDHFAHTAALSDD